MMDKVKNNKLLLSITSLGSATILNATLAFLIGIITRNILGPERHGFWLNVSILFTFVPIFQLGTLNAMNREIPFFSIRREKEKVEKIKKLVFSFIFTLPFAITLLLTGVSILLFIFGIRYEISLGLLFASVISFFTFFSNYIEMMYKSEQDFQKASRLISLRSITQSLFTVMCVYWFGYFGLYVGMLSAFLIQILAARKAFPKVKSIKIGSPLKLEEYKTLIRIGFPIMLVGLVWGIMVATDRMIITALMSPIDLGNYGVGLLVFSSVMLFPAVVNQVLYPKIVEQVSCENYRKVRSFFWKTNGILASVMLLVVVIGYIVLPGFVSFAMPEFVPGVRAAQILLMGVYPLTLVGVAAGFFNATNNQKGYLLIQVVSIVFNIILSLTMLRFRFTIETVALATSISFVLYMFLMNGYFLYILREKYILLEPYQAE